MKISLPNEITLKHINYNSKTPQDYFDDFSTRFIKFNITFNGFIIEDGWKGNTTLTSISYNDITYNNYRINKLYRYLKSIENGKFKRPMSGILTEEVLIKNVKDECIKRGSKIEFLGFKEFNGVRTYLDLRCNDLSIHDEPYEWSSTTYDSYFSNETGCSKCNGCYQYTIDELNTNLHKQSIKTGIKFIPITEENYNGVFSMILLECSCGYIWPMTYDNFVRDKGCPICTTVSYKTGYSSDDISSGLYILEVSEFDNIVGYKIGIAKNIKNRMNSYKGTCSYDLKIILYEKFERCNDAFDLEKKIKVKIPRRFLPKDKFGNGWTETVDPKYINEILHIIKGA